MDTEALAIDLRIRRNKKFSELANATITGSASSREVCFQWSQFADECLALAFKHCFDISTHALFALGKLGAEELNLSSDVDIVIISTNQNTNPSGLKRFIKILNEITASGFVFRLDFDLRPGGRMGSMISSVDEFVDYYGNYGETWERLALVRLREVEGSPVIIEQIQSFKGKFSFKKHLDMGLFEDFKNLRFSIQNEKRPLPPSQINLKLGVGGIRDIELFTQCLQIINGGKNKTLQTHSTENALSLLAQHSLLPQDQADFLKKHYWNLRTLENYVQRENQQTHILDTLEMAQFPPYIQNLTKTIESEMSKCHEFVKDLIGEYHPAQEISNLVPKDIITEIQDISLLSRHRQKDLLQRNTFVQSFSSELQKSNGNWEQGFANLIEFLNSTKAKASFYILLNRNPKLIEEMAWLFGHSPYLSQILCLRPELLDSYIFRSTDLSADSLEELLEKLTETKLLSELINGSQFLKAKNLHDLTHSCSDVADRILITLSLELKKEYPTEIEILCLGKWGTRELGLQSDLDFILVAPSKVTEVDLKFSRRLISRLTEAHRGGNIYAVDTRLRPSGKAGPLVIAAEELKNYLLNSSEPWERQIYLKARWLSTPLFNFDGILQNMPLTSEDLMILENIREQLIRPLTDIKYSEGGLLDIELAAQTAQLLKKSSYPNTQSALSELNWSMLNKNYTELRVLEQLGRLLSRSSSSQWDSALYLQLENLTGIADIQRYIQSLLQQNLDFMRQVDPRRLNKRT